MSTNPKTINVATPIVFLIGIFVVGAVVSSILSGLSDHRAQTIHDIYAQEFEEYRARNQEGLEKLFTEVFPDKRCEDPNDWDTCIKDIDPSDIYSNIDDSLKDFSSTAFVKKDSYNNEVMIIYLSGQVNRRYEEEEEILQLLDGEIESLPWDEYLYEFDQKEVILPVKDKDGNMLGAVIRGVIEE